MGLKVNNSRSVQTWLVMPGTHGVTYLKKAVKEKIHSSCEAVPEGLFKDHLSVTYLCSLWAHYIVGYRPLIQISGHLIVPWPQGDDRSTPL